MRLFGVELWKPRSVRGQLVEKQTGIMLPARAGSWFGIFTEAFSGAWQRNVVLDNTQTLLAFSAVFACISLIAGDIAKLRIKLLRRVGGFWTEDFSGAFSPVLRKPNRYQTRLQFIHSWMTSKLIWGNTYVLKERDERGVVVEMHVLNPQLVLPLVAPDGDVLYQLSSDALAGIVTGAPNVPASEIVHDRGICLFHPLVGIPPLYAAAASGTEGARIQTNSSKFFENMSRPSGHLTAPGQIDDATADRMKRDFEAKFSGQGVGSLLVTGDGIKYEAFTIPAQQAQLIEQLKFTGEDVARAFLVPLYKIGLGPMPSLSNIGALNQEYYQQVLQLNIEAIEALLDDGLKLPVDIGVEFDLEALLRMDPKTRAETAEIAMRAGVLKPDEARASEGRAPVPGGDTPYMQQQNFSLAALAKRDAQEDPFGTAKPPPAPPPDEDEDEEDDETLALTSLIAKFATARPPRVQA